MESDRANRAGLITGTNKFACICETLRSTYDLIHDMEDKELKEQITTKLVEAYTMAKKMADRLGYYKTTYPDDTSGHGGENLVRIPDSVKRKQIRGARKI